MYFADLARPSPHLVQLRDVNW